MSESNFIELTTAPYTGVTLDEAKDHLNLYRADTSQDDYISLLIAAAEQVVEARTSCIVTQRDFVTYFDSFDDDEVFFPIYPLVSITEFKYRNTAGLWQDISAGSYQQILGDLPPSLELKSGYLWPTDVSCDPQSVKITYKAGYAFGDLPSRVKLVVLFLVGHWYLHREPVVSDTAVLAAKVPRTLEYVMTSFKLTKIV